jgi:2-iminobutanoate/2-iminopropanoate deaminase
MSMTKIMSEQAPAAIGPYSQGIKAGNFIFVSGQLPLNALTGEMHTDIAVATRQSLHNVAAILAAANCSIDKIAKTTVFLSDLRNFPEMNQAYSEFFAANAPARSTIEVAALPKGAIVEIEAIAIAD